MPIAANSRRSSVELNERAGSADSRRRRHFEDLEGRSPEELGKSFGRGRVYSLLYAKDVGGKKKPTSARLIRLAGGARARNLGNDVDGFRRNRLNASPRPSPFCRRSATRLEAGHRGLAGRDTLAGESLF